MALVKVVGKINSGAGVVRNIGAVMPVEGQSVYQGPIPPTSVQQSDAAEALLLGASFEPSLLSAGPQVTENISEVSPPPMETAAANSAVVPDKSGSNGYLLVGAIIAGVGGVYYMGRQKGIVGKKSKNKKSSLTPFLLVGGAALAYWYFYVHTPDAPAAQVYTDPNTGVQTTVPVNTAPAGAITVSPEVAIPQEDVSVYNALYGYDTRYRYGIDRISTAARRDLYQYFFGYLKKGLRLYNQPGYFTDGWYNPQLYASIESISKQWNWNIIN